MKHFLLFGIVVLTLSQGFGQGINAPIDVNDVVVNVDGDKVKSMFIPSSAVNSLSTTHQGFRVRPKCAGEDRVRDCLIFAEPKIGGYELSGFLMSVFTYHNGRLHYGKNVEVESFVIVRLPQLATFAPDD